MIRVLFFIRKVAENREGAGKYSSDALFLMLILRRSFFAGVRA
ncbi:MAG: hypothetical protein UY89_C0009G0007 [Parcubacteria group bacterium GW2011_GWA1_54_9]|nr:MAG: hypothetical protein UY89_C0009G0007 [Parcubacteria group bacterium GW2011_GWA1_54_9]KKW42135.1 MAG: hypothetical protein UY91_C0006G0007 [Parcubacteria group bacterium GW2011_GWB1_55_9]